MFAGELADFVLPDELYQLDPGLTHELADPFLQSGGDLLQRYMELALSLHPGLSFLSPIVGSPGISIPEVLSANWRHAPTVTSVCPNQKPFVIFTACCGRSLSSQLLSPGEHPISNSPGGIQTYSCPSSGFCLTVPDFGVLATTSEEAPSSDGRCPLRLTETTSNIDRVRSAVCLLLNLQAPSTRSSSSPPRPRIHGTHQGWSLGAQ